jgi:hypothetical protein
LTLRSWVNTDSAGRSLRVRLAPGCLGELHCAGRDLLGEMILQDYGGVRRDLPAIALGQGLERGWVKWLNSLPRGVLDETFGMIRLTHPDANVGMLMSPIRQGLALSESVTLVNFVREFK